jgi:hypothetical protein
MFLWSMRSDSPKGNVRFRLTALLGEIRRREWIMFFWLGKYCNQWPVERVEIPISVIGNPLHGERYSKSSEIIITPDVSCRKILLSSSMLAVREVLG